jgi:hypothetical protein
MRASRFRLVYDGPDGGRGDPMDHIFWGVVSIGILAVLVTLLLRMLIEDFPANFSSGRRRSKLKS